MEVMAAMAAMAAIRVVLGTVVAVAMGRRLAHPSQSCRRLGSTESHRASPI